MTDSRPNSVTTTMAVVHPIEAFAVPSAAVFKSGCRLQGSFYGSDGYRAARAMFRSGFDLVPLGSLAQVRWPGIFARRFVRDPACGILFLTTSDVLEARPPKRRYISTALTAGLAGVTVSAGDILVTRSGTIGKVVLCTQDHAGSAVSEDALRVLPDSDSKGVLHAFLQSPAGQFLIVRSKSGSVVEHIYEDDLRDQLVPVVPRRLRHRLANLMEEVSRLRVEANSLLDDAEAEVPLQCELPELSTVLDSGVQTFVRRADHVASSANTFGSIRLDASAYDPRAQFVRAAISEVAHEKLDDLCKEIIYIGKVYRIPVAEREFGAPLLSGKDLVMLRPAADNFISILNAKHIERCRLQNGWVLVSCSGNIGRVAMCHRNFEGFIGSEHMLRVVCNDEQIDPFFMSAFLSSIYGQLQMQAATYGSVISELSKDQLRRLLIAIPNDRGAAIGAIARAAYDKRADALALEDEEIRLFESAIEEGKQATEEKWGQEY